MPVILAATVQPTAERSETGVLLRTANLNNITVEDIRKLKDDFRLSDIIDFRLEMELRGYEDQRRIPKQQEKTENPE